VTELEDSSASAIVEATVYMAHSLGLQIVAGGVETGSVLETLRDLGCDSVQGFLLHSPAQAEEVTVVLRSAHDSPDLTAAV
jgi:diguanylate cyclase